MDHFVVSARKYRPSTFNSVVGQPAITSTLKNAIKSKHLAQAFLFCGPRGVGKTTCARILAKTINCTNLTPDTEGCNECESCVSFNNGQSLNIFELDAASNNSVDDMRTLVEQVRYAPQSGLYKIYIIDEVHMLSQAAFNAFLKTLEEPPPYAIFILATTEKHKIIPTILSRCQIFDFNRITIDDIAKHLQWIAESEHVKAEPEALHMIAQKADGALRDALSIFDQIVSFAGNEVTYKHVIDNLNILDYEYYFKITDHLLAGDFANALLLLNEIIDEGFDVHHFISGLSAHFRDLLVCKDVQTIALLEVSEKTKERYKAQSQQCSAGLLFRFLEIGNRCDVEFKSSQNQRLHSELALLKMCSLKEGAFKGMPAMVSLPQPAEKKTPAVTSPVKTNPAPVEVPVKKEAETAPAAQANITENSKNQTVSTVSEPVTTVEPAKTPIASSAPIPEVVTAQQITSAPAPRSRSAATGTISISRKLQENKAPVESSENLIQEVQLNRPVEETELVGAVKQLVERLMSEGRRQLAVALNKHEPRLIDSLIIEIPVDNPIQADDIQSNKQEILYFLKEKLSNTGIEIHPKVTNTEETQGTAYTPADKFKKMAEKNPDLNQLRSQFDLELDF